jgi:cell division septation protein DedD
MEVSVLKKSITDWDRGSLLWGVIIALAVLIVAVAAAVKFLPKPTTPEPAPAVTRAKVPPMPPPVPIPAAPGLEAATPATAAVEDKSTDATATAGPATVPPTGDKIETVDLRKADKSQASPSKTLEVQKPGLSDPTTTGKEVKSPSMPPAAPTPKIESSATPQPVSTTASAAKPEPATAKASTKSKATEEKKREKGTAQIDLDKMAPFSIQVGAFRSKANADEISAQLTQKGYAPFIFQVTDAQQRSFYMVRFGHFGTRDEAAQALADYTRKQKQNAVIVRSESM